MKKLFLLVMGFILLAGCAQVTNLETENEQDAAIEQTADVQNAYVYHFSFPIKRSGKDRYIPDCNLDSSQYYITFEWKCNYGRDVDVSHNYSYTVDRSRNPSMLMCKITFVHKKYDLKSVGVGGRYVKYDR